MGREYGYRRKGIAAMPTGAVAGVERDSYSGDGRESCKDNKGDVRSGFNAYSVLSLFIQ